MPGRKRELFLEGKVRITVPVGEKDAKPTAAPVFYNPRMKLNRDISVMVLRAESGRGSDLRVCDPLAASGVRALRHAAEVRSCNIVIASDINRQAVACMRKNVRLNRLSRKIKVYRDEANSLLSKFSRRKDRFDYIDIDPFGSPAPFIESATRALKNSGLLGVTGTDLAVLCGARPKACLRKYGSRPLRTEYSKEIAARIVIGFVATVAARNELGVEPQLTHVTNHYVRTYLRLHRGTGRADESLRKVGYLTHCFGCLARQKLSKIEDFERVCDICGSMRHLAGPMWLNQSCDSGFCRTALEEVSTLDVKELEPAIRVLRLLVGEATGPAFHYSVDAFCRNLGLKMPKLESLLGELHAKRFIATRTHIDPRGFRTNADLPVIRDTMAQLAPK